MKSAIVKVKMQFNLFDNGNINEVERFLHLINKTIQKEFPLEQPQIFIGELEDYNIEIDNDELDYEPAKSIWSEIRDSFEDEGILHIDAWTSDDENDEDGKTIAMINLSNGEVEYLDERARTDINAQEIIQWHIDQIKDENQKVLDKIRDENWD